MLPDGTIVLPESNGSGSKVLTRNDIEEQTDLNDFIDEAHNAVNNGDIGEKVKRTLADVNVDFQRMNVTMIVASYTMWGLDSFAISRLLDTTPEKVDAILATDLYTTIRSELIDALRYSDASAVHGFLSSKAINAAGVIASTLQSKSVDARMAAAKDILDRTGFRPVDRVEHTMRFEDEMRIRYVTDDGHAPMIDLGTDNA